MTPSEPPRRPPPATGRQDRHRPQPPLVSDEPGAVPLRTAAPRGAAHESLRTAAPRGAAHYARARSQPYGLGCMIVIGVGALLLALIFIAIGLSPTDDEDFHQIVPASPAAPEASAPAPAPPAEDPDGSQN